MLQELCSLMWSHLSVLLLFSVLFESIQEITVYTNVLTSFLYFFLSGFKILSLIHFDSILYRRLDKHWISGCCLLISSPNMTEKLSCLPWMFVLFAENRLAVYNVVCCCFILFSDLHYLEFVYASLLTLIQCCLAYCGSIVYLENRKHDAYKFLIFFLLMIACAPWTNSWIVFLLVL